MVEGSPDDGNFLVRVRAQVMTRDEYGWVPMGGGGLSNVSVRKKVISEDDKKPEYIICGKRISDQTVVLSCTIKRDFQYNKVMPTFHHWRTGDKKFGLTFQTAADARAFDKGVRTAVEDLLEGVGCGHNAHGGDDLGDDDVFMALELPVESHSSTGSSSESGNGGWRPPSTTPSLPGDTTSPHQHHLYRIHFMKPSRTMPTGGSGSPNVGSLTSSVSAGHGELQHGTTPQKDQDNWTKDKQSTEQIELSTLGSYSYVQFSKDRAGTRAATEPEYHYPSIESFKASRPEDFKKQPISTVTTSQPPLLPSKGKNSRRQQSPNNELRCRLCLDTYVEEDNRPGSCRFGRDRTLSCINHATCYTCSQCMLYHCMSDAEGDFHHHPCSCDGSDGRCCKRWTGLAVLSLFVPCLWCYLPLRACHRCGVGCSYCGGKHEPE